MSVLIRLGCCCCLLSILIAGPVAWRLQRYSSIPGGTELRFCQCAHFFAEGGHCGELLYPEAVFQTHWDNLTKTQPMTCNVSAGVVRARSGDLMEDAEAWLLQRPIQNTFLPVFLLLVLMTLAAAVLLLPIIPEFFLLVFNVFVPVLLFAFTFFLVQFRVLGAITEEHYFGCALDRHVWHRLVQTGLVLAILGMFYSRFLRTFMHRYYSRSLHRAFYAKGENCTWADVRQCIYCPMLLVSATVNDYMQLGDTTPFSYMTFNQLFAGGSRLGYFLAYGQRPLARTAALSGGAIDGFIMGRKDDSMSLRFWLEGLGLFMGDFVSISRKPGEWVSLHKHAAVLVFTVVYVLLLVASYFSGPEARPGDCLAAKRFVQVAAWWALAFGVLSFFGFFKCLGWLQHSPLIRTLQQATMFYYQSPRPPRSVYISDGGVIENTGILALMQRRCRRILAVYVGEEEKGEDFGCLQKLLQTMHDENIGYLYHLQDPRKGPLHAIRECAWNEGYFLELGICYYDDRGAGNANILTVVRNKVPRGKYPVWQHLSQEEVLGTVGPEIDDAFEMQQTELGGCCCDCCHKTWCNRCMGHFPEPPTANQFLTPHMFNALCRLGRALLPVGVVARL